MVYNLGPLIRGPLPDTLSVRRLRGKGDGLQFGGIHTAIEAEKVALPDGSEYYGHPNFRKVTMEVASKMHRELVDPNQASLEVRPDWRRIIQPHVAALARALARKVDSHSFLSTGNHYEENL